jgi:hypothetical protein
MSFLTHVSLDCVGAGQFLAVLEVFCSGCVLGVVLFQGLEKSLRLSGTFVVRLLQPPA